MMKLTILPPGFGEISGSPFSAKSFCLLERSGQPYDVAQNPDPRKTPKQKYPVLQDGDRIIPDSDQIRDYLEATYAIDFDEGLSAQQRAVSRMIIRTMEENVYFAIVVDRWLEDDNWPVTRSEFFKGMPPVLGGLIAWQVRKGVKAQCFGQGMGRHSEAERVERVAKDLAAFEVLLADKPFVHGDQPTAVDMSAVPMLRAVASFPKQTALGDLVSKNEVLSAYIARGKDAMYPDEA